MEPIDKLAERLDAVQEFSASFQEFIGKNFLIEGRTMESWKKHFHIDIPADINFQTVIRLSSELFTKYQRAAYYRDKQVVQLSILEQVRADRYHTAYATARQDHEKKHGKTLAADSCKVAASLAVQDIENAITNQRVIKDFWVKTADVLTELRKLVETLGYALSGEARIHRDMVIRGK